MEASDQAGDAGSRYQLDQSSIDFPGLNPDSETAPRYRGLLYLDDAVRIRASHGRLNQ